MFEKTLAAPGQVKLETAPLSGVRVTLSIDKDFQAPGDNRRLGFILSGIGFRE